MKMKRSIILCLALVLFILLGSCGNSVKSVELSYENLGINPDASEVETYDKPGFDGEPDLKISVLDDGTEIIRDAESDKIIGVDYPEINESDDNTPLPDADRDKAAADFIKNRLQVSLGDYTLVKSEYDERVGYYTYNYMYYYDEWKTEDVIYIDVYPNGDIKSFMAVCIGVLKDLNIPKISKDEILEKVEKEMKTHYNISDYKVNGMGLVYTRNDKLQMAVTVTWDSGNGDGTVSDAGQYLYIDIE